MRHPFVPCLLAALLLAGCTGDSPEDDPGDLVQDAGRATTDPEASSTEEPGGGNETSEQGEGPLAEPGTPLALYPGLVTARAAGNATFPSWRPDGRAFAYLEWTPGQANASALVLRTPWSGVYQEVTGPRFVGPNPAWNPAGTKLAVGAKDGASTYLYIVDADAGTASKVTAAVDVTPFQWLDEGILAVSNRTGHSEIFLFHENGTVARQVTDDQVWKWAPSADEARGKLLLVAAQDRVANLTPGPKEPAGWVARYDLTSGAFERWIAKDGWHARPMWRPGAAEVAFLSSDDGVLHRTSLDGFPRGTFGSLEGAQFDPTGALLLYHPCGDGDGSVCEAAYAQAVGD